MFSSASHTLSFCLFYPVTRALNIYAILWVVASLMPHRGAGAAGVGREAVGDVPRGRGAGARRGAGAPAARRARPPRAAGARAGAGCTGTHLLLLMSFMLPLNRLVLEPPYCTLVAY